MKCPICGRKAINLGNSPNGETLYVAEESECYDTDVYMFRCQANIRHIFYIDPKLEDLK
jgi:hypothetical protein